MRIGKNEGELLLPFAIEAEKFEKKISPKVSGIAKRRVEAFYTKYSLNDDSIDSTVKGRLKELYPGISEYDFYILRDDASDRDKKLLTEYIAETDYTVEDYQDDIKKSGSTDEVNAEDLIRITIEFTLSDGDLIVHIPAEKIRYDISDCLKRYSFRRWNFSVFLDTFPVFGFHTGCEFVFLKFQLLVTGFNEILGQINFGVKLRYCTVNFKLHRYTCQTAFCGVAQYFNDKLIKFSSRQRIFEADDIRICFG